VGFPLGGDCDDGDFGLSSWAGRAVATNGNEVRAEIQLDAATTVVALYLDPDAKDTPYRIQFPTESSPGKAASGLLQPMLTAEFGELKVIGEWRCRS